MRVLYCTLATAWKLDLSAQTVTTLSQARCNKQYYTSTTLYLHNSYECMIQVSIVWRKWLIPEVWEALQVLWERCWLMGDILDCSSTLVVYRGCSRICLLPSRYVAEQFGYVGRYEDKCGGPLGFRMRLFRLLYTCHYRWLNSSEGK